MDICLINPLHVESLDSKLDPPLGLLYIASIIRNLGHKVQVIDLSFHPNQETWKEVIPKADLYGITVMSASLHHAINIKNICKEINSDCKVIVGGAHPSALPEETANLGFDIVCIGEIENRIPDIIYYSSLKKSTFPIFIDGNIELMNINDIPFPARDLVPIIDYTRTVNGTKATSLMASRGCPYKCSFCMNSTRKSPVRFRNIDNIIKEMKEVILKYNFKAFIFYDDTFTLHPQLTQLLEEIKKLNIIFRCNGNTRKDKLRTFEKLYDAGCREIAFGIESGSQTILNNINKNIKVYQNELAISNAKKASLIVKAFLMIGSPGEKWETIGETIKFMNKTKPQQWTLFNFVPLPGCDIYNNPEKYKINILTKDYKEYYNIARQNEGGITIETESMSSNEIKEAREYLLKYLPKQEGYLQSYYSNLTTK